ncbi:MAG: hypothetical protein HON68_03085 [Gammaproteobacteria bacterium]|jgi:hypothetical protein|nr:hypothetical protein [Gammaproteobacteria bacterium]MBT3490251.1 hypothetical protein [Gammaproteobacteria bacterium]MBT3719844.1 hypothetical protein [Gammaproteobacteria bacterium]MBT3845692.1 hypothetical protein [Gammaproteobacteria bacterium]MBT3893131.1 hypothetical protein [Gammaproteobacteria bacterium]
MAPFPRFDREVSCEQNTAARKKADEAIGGFSHECEIGWKAGVTRRFMRVMARSGGYVYKHSNH